jgi:hypothetical protein
VKTWTIEMQRVKAMSNANGLIRAQIEAIVQPSSAREDGMPSSTLTFTEETARVLLLLLKQQLADFDSRKAKSRR